MTKLEITDEMRIAQNKRNHDIHPYKVVFTFDGINDTYELYSEDARIVEKILVEKNLPHSNRCIPGVMGELVLSPEVKETVEKELRDSEYNVVTEEAYWSSWVHRTEKVQDDEREKVHSEHCRADAITIVNNTKDGTVEFYGLDAEIVKQVADEIENPTYSIRKTANDLLVLQLFPDNLPRVRLELKNRGYNSIKEISPYEANAAEVKTADDPVSRYNALVERRRKLTDELHACDREKANLETEARKYIIAKAKERNAGQIVVFVDENVGIAYDEDAQFINDHGLTWITRDTEGAAGGKVVSRITFMLDKELHKLVRVAAVEEHREVVTIPDFPL